MITFAHFVELDGFGHNFYAWHFALPGLLRWLLAPQEENSTR
jgi:hypothetical protein